MQVQRVDELWVWRKGCLLDLWLKVKEQTETLRAVTPREFILLSCPPISHHGFLLTYHQRRTKKIIPDSQASPINATIQRKKLNPHGLEEQLGKGPFNAVYKVVFTLDFFYTRGTSITVMTYKYGEKQDRTGGCGRSLHANWGLRDGSSA